jgi:hypothetical protein
MYIIEQQIGTEMAAVTPEAAKEAQLDIARDIDKGSGISDELVDKWREDSEYNCRVLKVLAVYHMSRKPASKYVQDIIRAVTELDADTGQSLAEHSARMQEFVEWVQQHQPPTTEVNSCLQEMATEASGVDIQVLMDLDSLNREKMFETERENTRRYNSLLKLVTDLLSSDEGCDIDAQAAGVDALRTLTEQLQDPGIVDDENREDITKLATIMQDKLSEHSYAEVFEPIEGAPGDEC